jgi:hypothetical protein
VVRKGGARVLLELAARHPGGRTFCRAEGAAIDSRESRAKRFRLANHLFKDSTLLRRYAMKKKVRKLVLGRETLRSLEQPQGVAGGISAVGGCSLSPACLFPTQFGIRCAGDTGTYDTCANTANCSTNCTTGGTACTA